MRADNGVMLVAGLRGTLAYCIGEVCTPVRTGVTEDLRSVAVTCGDATCVAVVVGAHGTVLQGSASRVCSATSPRAADCRWAWMRLPAPAGFESADFVGVVHEPDVFVATTSDRRRVAIDAAGAE